MEIWNKFKEYKLAFGALCFLVFLAVAAIYAPLIGNNKPLVIYTSHELIFRDFLDSAEGTLASILTKMREGKPVSTKNARWLSESTRQTALFLEDEELAAELLSVDSSRAIGRNDQLSLNKLSELLSRAGQSPRKKRLFFPLFRSLEAADIFFMLIPLFLLLIKLFKFRIPKLKMFSFWDRLAAAVLLSLLFGSLMAALKPERFDAYHYKKMVSQFEQGEWALFPLVAYGENENIILEASQAPTYLLSETERKPEQNFHLLGTDTNGRDVLVRMIYGTRISMSVGFVAVGIYVLIGILLGALAGYFGGFVDTLISRVIEIIICFPVFFLILTVMAFLKPSIYNIMIIIGLTGWTGIARLMRGEFLRLKNQEFVLAARGLGASDYRIIFRHILPNGMAPIIVSATFGIAGAILTESALSFLGFGVPQPTASWGDILNNGRNDIYHSWWLTVFPGVMIFLTVTAFNLIGETFRDIMDPRLRGLLSLRKKARVQASASLEK